MNLSFSLGEIKIEPAIMNASGILAFPPLLKKLSDFDVGALVLKSVCTKKREGFKTPVVARSSEAFLNAVGLPGPGCYSLKEQLEEIYPLKKPLIASIFDDSSEGIAEVASCLENVCDAFELNFSCPNLMPGEKTGVAIGRDPNLVRKYTESVRSTTKKPIIVKLPPGPYIEDRERIKEIALSAVDSGADSISAINTIPGGMKIDVREKKPVLTAKFGGLSGKAIKPIGIGCVYTIYEALNESKNVPIIGIGGIETAEDVVEYIEAGASAVAIGTVFWIKKVNEVENYLSDLKNNLEKLIEDLGFNSLQELKGIAHE